MIERKYLPTFAELVDRLSIVLLKSIFIPENRDAYLEEMKLIEHDIDHMLFDPNVDRPTDINANALRAILMIAFANREIWLNESEARSGGSEQDKLLKFSHSINGVRAQAKNILAARMGERTDLKTDSFAAEFGDAYGNWNVFDV
jgi:hypothetical protein